MEDYFVIPNHKIETAWNPRDRSLELFVLEYCEEVLDLPLFLVAEAHFSNAGLEIELQNLEDWMIGEAWYINLFRVGLYAQAS